jgi:hypothetical protein
MSGNRLVFIRVRPPFLKKCATLEARPCCGCCAPFMQVVDFLGAGKGAGLPHYNITMSIPGVPAVFILESDSGHLQLLRQKSVRSRDGRL